MALDSFECSHRHQDLYISLLDLYGKPIFLLSSSFMAWSDSASWKYDVSLSFRGDNNTPAFVSWKYDLFLSFRGDNNTQLHNLGVGRGGNNNIRTRLQFEKINS